MENSIQLGSRLIHSTSSPYIIAEIGVNHEGSYELAKQLILLAKDAGADAVKFQSYKANTLASKNSPAYWDTNKENTLSQFELFQKYDSFEASDYVNLFEFCQSLDIDFLSTPFDDASIDFLEPIVPFYKIASADLTNLPFLRRVGKKSKPVVLSTGASTTDEINLALNTLESVGCTDVALLHCILNYPTINKNAHLRMIESLKSLYPNRIIGYSDHTLPDINMSTLTTAYALGAVILEKHFTHDKSLPGNDHYHSMDHDDLIRCKEALDHTSSLLGNLVVKQPISTEEISRKNARRSIVISQDVAADSILTESILTYKRPGTGISPLFWDKIINRKVNKFLPADHVLQWEDLKPI